MRPGTGQPDADERAPLGAFAPTPAQAAVIRLARAIAYTGATVRSAAWRLVRGMRPGPIDYPTCGLNVRFWPHLNPRDRAALFAERSFDRHERDLIVARLPPGGVFLDIGANNGVYTLHVGAARPDARVHAFEPLADVAARLRFNVEANGMASRVFVRAMALADHAGTLRFDAGRESAVLGDGGTEVPCDTLLDFARAEGLTHIDAIKIDVEGFEDRVLAPFFAAAEEMLWPRLVVIEHIMPDIWQVDCLALLMERGYRQVWRGGFNSVYERSAEAGSQAAATGER